MSTESDLSQKSGSNAGASLSATPIQSNLTNTSSAAGALNNSSIAATLEILNSKPSFSPSSSNSTSVPLTVKNETNILTGEAAIPPLPPQHVPFAEGHNKKKSGSAHPPSSSSGEGAAIPPAIPLANPNPELAVVNTTHTQVDTYLEYLDMKEVILKIMKRIVPPSVTIDPAGRDLVLDCMLEFASSLSNEVVVLAGQTGVRTLTGSHFEHAVSVLGYEDYVKPIATFNQKREDHIAKGCTSCGGRLEPFRKKSSHSSKSKSKTAKGNEEKTDGDTNAADGSQRSRSQQQAWEQLDATTMENFAERLKAAMDKSDPTEDLRRMSKDLNITMKLLRQKLSE